jgi:hypothetical protein
MRTRLLLSLIAAIASSPLVACGDDAGGEETNDSTDTGGGPGPGPANEVDAEIEGGTAAGAVEGESEESEAEQNYATLHEGRLDVYLASNAGIVFFTVNVADTEVPGRVSVDGDLLGSGFLNISGATGVFEGTGGSISVNQCPNDGGVVTGTFNDVALRNAATQSADGTLSGTWRATIAQNDESATCVVPDPVDEDAGGSEPVCDLETCDGPCCPYVEPIATCEQGCIMSQACMDPFNADGCIECLDQCVVDSGVLEDAECGEKYTDYAACEEAEGCAELEDDAYYTCMESNCCAEVAAAF